MKYVLYFGGAAILIALIIALVKYFERKRREALRDWSRLMGYSFSEKGDDDLKLSLSRFHLFSKGHSRKIRNVMTRRSDETEITLMDYRYTTGGGKNSHTWNQTVISYRCPRLSLPPFALRPENIFHKIGGAFGYEDIDFDAHPLFSKQYLLRGPDEVAIRQLFTQSRLEFYGRNKGLCTEGDGDQLIFYRSSKRVAPEKLRAFIEKGAEVLRLFQTV